MGLHPRKNTESCKPRRIYGFHVVREYLRAHPEQLRTVYLLPSVRHDTLVSLAAEHQIPVQQEARSFFDQLARDRTHQGVAALMAPFAYTPLDTILQAGGAMLLVADGVLDPRNLGALLRTAEAVGVAGVLLPDRRSASLSAVVEKAATGATAHLPICRMTNTSRALERVRAAGYWLVGLDPAQKRTLYQLQVPDKVALLIGGEERGLRPLIRRECDYVVSIPMRGAVESLNVSVAGAVALYELFRQRVSGPRVVGTTRS